MLDGTCMCNTRAYVHVLVLQNGKREEFETHVPKHLHTQYAGTGERE